MHMTSHKQTDLAVSRLLMLALGLPLAALAQTASQPAAAPEGDTLILEKFTIEGMKSFSDQAIAGETPVAFTEIGKELITQQLGSRDIPLVLNTTPSVYATTDGGAAGDARVNVRGFSQRNVSILINGVPTNDVENGWLYWSNWDGLGDVTATIQVQRGLSNVTLPTPSIGGTMNVITDPASAERGGSVKFEMGSDSFMKATAVLNTGMLKDKFALTIGAVRKVGDGNPRGGWSDAYGYYVGSTWVVNDINRLEFFLIGAPQQHGQRRFASNIAAYDADYARSLGYTEAQIVAAGAVGPVNAGQDFNPNYSPLTTSYNGQQFYWGGLHSRYDNNMMNESVNYFHKPQANINWYYTPSEQLSLTSVFYYSGGRGGGSGTLHNTTAYSSTNSSSHAFARYPNSNIPYGSNLNWDSIIAANIGTQTVTSRPKAAGQSIGILRNSVNNQDQFGIVSKVAYEMSEAVKLTAGVDWRTAEIAHFREVRDLLGGDYYLPSAAQASEFWANGASTQLKLGDKVDYNNTNTVDWLGLFVQGQYESGPITAFGVAGYSTISYGYEDFFRRAAPGSSETFKLDSGNIDGNQFKGGVNYKFNQQFSTFVNLGVISKIPNFDGAINDVAGVMVPNSSNEKFKSAEVGLRFESADRKFNVSASYYHTKWENRTLSFTNTQPNPDEQYYLYGSDSLYKGLEIEAAWQPIRMLRFDFAASFGNWTYTNDVNGQVYNAETQALIRDGTVYLNNLKVGDAPQTQLALGVTLYPVNGLSIKLQGRAYDRYWSEFDPGSRFNPADRGQSWQIPNYEIFDLHVNYRLPIKSDKFDVSVFAHVFNLTDETYISDATDNSSFEAINSAPSHSPMRAEVFLGPPVAYNLGATIRF